MSSKVPLVGPGSSLMRAGGVVAWEGIRPRQLESMTGFESQLPALPQRSSVAAEADRVGILFHCRSKAPIFRTYQF